jgi:hypothetical protein
LREGLRGSEEEERHSGPASAFIEHGELGGDVTSPSMVRIRRAIWIRVSGVNLTEKDPGALERMRMNVCWSTRMAVVHKGGWRRGCAIVLSTCGERRKTMALLCRVGPA